MNSNIDDAETAEALGKVRVLLDKVAIAILFSMHTRTRKVPRMYLDFCLKTVISALPSWEMYKSIGPVSVTVWSSFEDLIFSTVSRLESAGMLKSTAKVNSRSSSGLIGLAEAGQEECRRLLATKGGLRLFTLVESILEQDVWIENDEDGFLSYISFVRKGRRFNIGEHVVIDDESVGRTHLNTLFHETGGLFSRWTSQNDTIIERFTTGIPLSRSRRFRSFWIVLLVKTFRPRQVKWCITLDMPNQISIGGKPATLPIRVDLSSENHFRLHFDEEIALMFESPRIVTREPHSGSVLIHHQGKSITMEIIVEHFTGYAVIVLPLNFLDMVPLPVSLGSPIIADISCLEAWVISLLGSYQEAHLNPVFPIVQGRISREVLRVMSHTSEQLFVIGEVDPKELKNLLSLTFARSLYRRISVYCTNQRVCSYIQQLESGLGKDWSRAIDLQGFSSLPDLIQRIKEANSILIDSPINTDLMMVLPRDPEYLAAASFLISRVKPMVAFNDEPPLNVENFKDVLVYGCEPTAYDNAPNTKLLRMKAKDLATVMFQIHCEQIKQLEKEREIVVAAVRRSAYYSLLSSASYAAANNSPFLYFKESFHFQDCYDELDRQFKRFRQALRSKDISGISEYLLFISEKMPVALATTAKEQVPRDIVSKVEGFLRPGDYVTLVSIGYYNRMDQVGTMTSWNLRYATGLVSGESDIEVGLNIIRYLATAYLPRSRSVDFSLVLHSGKGEYQILNPAMEASRIRSEMAKISSKLQEGHDMRLRCWTVREKEADPSHLFDLHLNLHPFDFTLMSCHGGYDPDSGEAFLSLEKLITSSEIIQRWDPPIPPIMFVIACSVGRCARFHSIEHGDMIAAHWEIPAVRWPGFQGLDYIVVNSKSKLGWKVGVQCKRSIGSRLSYNRVKKCSSYIRGTSAAGLYYKGKEVEDRFSDKRKIALVTFSAFRRNKTQRKRFDKLSEVWDSVMVFDNNLSDKLPYTYKLRCDELDKIARWC